MADARQALDQRRRTLAAIEQWLVHCIGLGVFGLGIAYWVRLVGVFPEPGWRFDLMAGPSRVVAVTLAVLYPVAGTGLWLSAPWGIVVWLMALGASAVLYLGPAEAPGGPDAELLVQAAAFVALVGLRLAVLRLRQAFRRQGPAKG